VAYKNVMFVVKRISN